MFENSPTGLSAPDSAAFWREHVRLNHGGLTDREGNAEASDSTD